MGLDPKKEFFFCIQIGPWGCLKIGPWGCLKTGPCIH
jgi:hypothetical protein